MTHLIPGIQLRPVRRIGRASTRRFPWPGRSTGVRVVEGEFYPMVKLFNREFPLSAKARSLVFTHCAWVLESLARKTGQLTGELEQGTRSRPKGV